MQNFIDKTNEHLEHANEIIDDLRIQFPDLITKTEKISFRNFHLFEDRIKIRPLLNVYIESAGSGISVSFLHTQYKVSPRRDGSDSSTSLKIVLSIPLKEDAGHIFIKRETVADKIREYFQPLETDFGEDLEFSRAFYVLAKDKPKAVALLNTKFRTVLKAAEIRDLQLEIRHRFIVIDCPENEEPGDMINFGLKLSAILNR